MSATTQSPASKQPGAGKGTGNTPRDGRTGAPARTTELVSWKAGIGLGLLGLFGAGLGAFYIRRRSKHPGRLTSQGRLIGQLSY